MRSRVMPGSSVTIERRVPVRRLKSVDLPTFGRPTITMDGSLAAVIVFKGLHRMHGELSSPQVQTLTVATSGSARADEVEVEIFSAGTPTPSRVVL